MQQRTMLVSYALKIFKQQSDGKTIMPSSKIKSSTKPKLSSFNPKKQASMMK